MTNPEGLDDSRPAPRILPIPWDRPRRGPLLKTALTLLAVCATSCVACAIVGRRASTEGGEVADALLPRISQPWNSGALADNATPELLSALPDDRRESFVSFLAKRLGPLKSAAPFRSSQWTVFIGTKGLAVRTVQFSDCVFEKAPARITLTLVRAGGVWRINSLHANSDALLQ